jgi:hypothetical protein
MEKTCIHEQNPRQAFSHRKGPMPRRKTVPSQQRLLHAQQRLLQNERRAACPVRTVAAILAP